MSAPETNPRTERTRPGTGRTLLAAGALLVAFALMLEVAGGMRRPIIVDIGPSTGRYGSGFEDSEETPPTTSRWTRQNAEFDVPLNVSASMVRFAVRAARYLDEPTEITVTADGRAFTSFEQPRGRQRIQEMEAPIPEGPLNLALKSADPNLGMALDWIRIDGARWRVPAREWTVWILPVGLFASLLLAGASLRIAAATTFLLLALLATVAAVDPFGFVHIARDVSLPTIAFSVLIALIFKGEHGLVTAVAATLLLKGGFLFHPNYFYNDVRQNDRYVGALKTYEGSLMERSIKAQVDLGVGYPRIVGGKKYAFPYSPVFYLPFTALPSDRDLVVRAIKHVALFTTALEVALGFVLARSLLPTAATLAAWLTFAFPILTSRMLYAMWSTLAGHALDLVVIVMAVRLLSAPGDRKKETAFLFLATVATFLTYVSSLFNTTAFLIALALLVPNVRWRVLGLWIAAAGLIVFGMYGSFTLSFVTEIIPALISGQGGTNAAMENPGLFDAFARIGLFAGYGFPLLAAAGLLTLVGRKDPAATTLKAYALAFLGLLLLRGLAYGLFKDLKEIEFAGPGFAILAAGALARVEIPSARHLIAAGLIVGGLWMQYGSFERWSQLVLG